MSDQLKLLDRAAIAALSQSARDSSRQRAHALWHESHQDAVQKITMWLEPDTYVRPHQHPHDTQWEVLVLLSGAVRLLLFDSSAMSSPAAVPRISQVITLSPDTLPMVQIPAQQWHTLVALQPSLLFEVKQGPMVAAMPQDFASWAPAEGDPLCGAFNAYWRNAAEGDPGADSELK